jgi:hypothetical protein
MAEMRWWITYACREIIEASSIFAFGIGAFLGLGVHDGA